MTTRLFSAFLLAALLLSACSTASPQVITPTVTLAAPLEPPTWEALAAATEGYATRQPDTTAFPGNIQVTLPASPTPTLAPLPSATPVPSATLPPSVNADPDTFDYTTLAALSQVMLSPTDVLADRSVEATLTIFYREPPAREVDSTAEMVEFCRYHKDCAKKIWFAGLHVRTTVMLIRAPSVSLAIRAAQGAATDYSKTNRKKMTWWLGGEQDTASFLPLLSENGLPAETWLLAKDETHYFIATHRGPVVIIIFDEFEANPDFKVNMDDHARALLLLARLQNDKLEKAGFPR